MISFADDSFRNPKHVYYWYGLAFQAGAINAGGFLSCRSFVSHVTGVGTQIGMNIGIGKFIPALELLTIPFSFLLGAIVAAFLVDDRQAKGLRPAYVIVTGLILFLLLSVITIGLIGGFGPFGEPFELLQDVALVSSLCMACGLQNASGVTATQGTIRTTHLTGILTDYGINLVRNRHLKKFSKGKYKQVIFNRIRLKTFLSFSMGSTLTSIVCLKYKYWGFLIPCTTATLFFYLSLLASKFPDFLQRTPTGLKNL